MVIGRYNFDTTSRAVLLYAYLILSYCDWYSTVRCAATAAKAARLMHQHQSNAAEDDSDNGYREEDKLFDWLNDEDEDDYDDLSPVRVDEDLAGRMNGFFNKLNSLRQKHRETRWKSKYQPFVPNHHHANNIPSSVRDTEHVVIDIGHHHAGHHPLVDSTPLPPSVMMDNGQKNGWNKGIR